MSFSQPDELLGILQTDNVNLYEPLSEFCKVLLEKIESKHKNGKGIEYPSALTQCILECIRVKNNFEGRVWYSTKNYSKDLFVSYAVPVVFSRLALNKKDNIIMVDYELYNGDQLINDADEYCEEKKLKFILLEVLKTLNSLDERNISIFCQRYGLWDGVALTLEKIGKSHSISRERVRQIIVKILRRLRSRLTRFKKSQKEDLIIDYFNRLKVVEEWLRNNYNNGGVSEKYVREVLVNEFGVDNIICIDLINNFLEEKINVIYGGLYAPDDGYIRKAILSFLREFPMRYGKTGLIRVLKGSSAIKDSKYNSGALQSIYYGLLKSCTTRKIASEIEGLIRIEEVVMENVGFYPLLIISPDIELDSDDFLPGKEILASISYSSMAVVDDLENNGAIELNEEVFSPDDGNI